jgi:type IV pilus assembly protein PilB
VAPSVPARVHQRSGDHELLSQQYRIPTINLREFEVDREILALVPAEVCRRLVVLPVSRIGSSVILAMADPTNEATKTEIAKATGSKIEPVIASEADITKAIDRYYGDT